MGVVFLNIIPAINIGGALIIETDKQVRGAPTEAVTKGKRGHFPKTHFQAAVAAERFFLG